MLENRSAAFRQQIDITRTIGRRMRESRELCNYSLTFAAKQLGYRNPSKLSKIENPRDRHCVPLHTLARAAVLYGVSVDFLFGLSEDWERAPEVARERSVATWLGEEWERQKARDLSTFAVLAGKIHLLEAMQQKMAAQAQKIAAAMDAFAAANRRFIDMPKSAPVLGSITAMAGMAVEADAMLKRLCKGNPSTPAGPDDVASAVERLARLGEFDYERARRAEAAVFGVRACYVDAQVKRRRMQLLADSGAQMRMDL